MGIGANAWYMKYHVEMESDTGENWGEIPAYAEEWTNTLGEGALSNLKKNTDANMSQCLSCARQIYDNFMSEIV